MTTIPSVHRSTFGMRCAHCNTALIAPEWTERGGPPYGTEWRLG